MKTHKSVRWRIRKQSWGVRGWDAVSETVSRERPSDQVTLTQRLEGSPTSSMSKRRSCAQVSGQGMNRMLQGCRAGAPTWSQDRVSSASGGSDTSLRHWGKAMWVCQWSACAPRETWVQPGSRACWPCDKVWHHGLSWSSALRTQALPSRGPYGNSEEERDASSLKTDLQPPQEKQRTNSSKGKTFGRLKRVRDVNQSQWCWAMWTHWPAFRHILDHKKKEKKRKSYMDVKKKKLFRLHSLA